MGKEEEGEGGENLDNPAAKAASFPQLLSRLRRRDSPGACGHFSLPFPGSSPCVTTPCTSEWHLISENAREVPRNQEPGCCGPASAGHGVLYSHGDVPVAASHCARGGEGASPLRLCCPRNGEGNLGTAHSWARRRSTSSREDQAAKGREGLRELTRQQPIPIPGQALRLRAFLQEDKQRVGRKGWEAPPRAAARRARPRGTRAQGSATL